MRVLKNRRFVDGKGRRYIDNVDGSLQPYGLMTLTTVNSAVGGYLKRDADQAIIDQKAACFSAPTDGRCVDIVVTIRTVVGAENRVKPLGRLEAGFHFVRRYGPALCGPMTRPTTTTVGP